MASWRSMTKIAEDGSGATSQRHGSVPKCHGSATLRVLQIKCWTNSALCTFSFSLFLDQMSKFYKESDNLTCLLSAYLRPLWVVAGFLLNVVAGFVLLLLLQVAEAYGCARERGEQTPGLSRVRQTVPHQKAGQNCQPVPSTYWCEVYRYLCVGTDIVVGFFSLLHLFCYVGWHSQGKKFTNCSHSILFLFGKKHFSLWSLCDFLLHVRGASSLAESSVTCMCFHKGVSVLVLHTDTIPSY